MKHLKHHPINDELPNLSDDMKEQGHVKKQEPSNKKLDADKSLSDPTVSNKVQKPNNKKLDGENFLSEEVASTVKMHPIDNKSQHLAKTKKENHIKFKKKDKNLKPEKYLQEVEVPTKKIKTSHDILGGEKSLSTDGGKIKNFQNFNK